MGIPVNSQFILPDVREMNYRAMVHKYEEIAMVSVTVGDFICPGKLLASMH